MKTKFIYLMVAFMFTLSYAFCQETNEYKTLTEGSLSYTLRNGLIYKSDNPTEKGQSHSVVYFDVLKKSKQPIEDCFRKIFSKTRAQELSKKVGLMTCYLKFDTINKRLVAVEFYMRDAYKYVTLKELNDLEIELRKLSWFSYMDVQEESPIQNAYLKILKGTIFSKLYD